MEEVKGEDSKAEIPAPRCEVVKTSGPGIDLIAKETLKRLGAPPCHIKVEKDMEVPEYVIVFWRNKGIEVEPIGVIKVRFRDSRRVYIYPYRIS